MGTGFSTQSSLRSPNCPVSAVTPSLSVGYPLANGGRFPQQRARKQLAAACRSTFAARGGSFRDHVVHRLASRDHRQHVFLVGHLHVEHVGAVVGDHFFERRIRSAFLLTVAPPQP